MRPLPPPPVGACGHSTPGQVAPGPWLLRACLPLLTKEGRSSARLSQTAALQPPPQRERWGVLGVGAACPERPGPLSRGSGLQACPSPPRRSPCFPLAPCPPLEEHPTCLWSELKPYATLGPRNSKLLFSLPFLPCEGAGLLWAAASGALPPGPRAILDRVSSARAPPQPPWPAGPGFALAAVIQREFAPTSPSLVLSTQSTVSRVKRHFLQGWLQDPDPRPHHLPGAEAGASVLGSTLQALCPPCLHPGLVPGSPHSCPKTARSV